MRGWSITITAQCDSLSLHVYRFGMLKATVFLSLVLLGLVVSLPFEDGELVTLNKVTFNHNIYIYIYIYIYVPYGCPTFVRLSNWTTGCTTGI